MLMLGVWKNGTVEKEQQEKIYNIYIEYMNAKGEIPLTYEEWLDSIKEEGEQWNPGKDGWEVEFQSTDTHIQWRYVTEDNSDTWKNLITFEDLKEKEEVIDGDAINQIGFELFKSKLNSISNDYKVIYDYAEKRVVESFINYGFSMNQYDSSGNILGVRASIEYNYNSSFSLDGVEKWFCGY